MLKFTRPGRLHSYLLFALMMCVSTLSVAKTDISSFSPGTYCPGPNILLIVAEDLSTSLTFVMQSRAAQARKDQAEMVSLLEAAGVVLKQATSRGGGARTALLINSVILSRATDTNEQLLTWFPLLHSALLTLPEDDARNAADAAIAGAEEILRDGQGGNALDQLKKASHFLTCDDLNLPLQAAIAEQQRLLSLIQQRKPVVTKDYDKLIGSLRTAVAYVLGHGKI